MFLLKQQKLIKKPSSIYYYCSYLLLFIFLFTILILVNMSQDVRNPKHKVSDHTDCT